MGSAGEPLEILAETDVLVVGAGKTCHLRTSIDVQDLVVDLRAYFSLTSKFRQFSLIDTGQLQTPPGRTSQTPVLSSVFATLASKINAFSYPLLRK